MAKAFPKSPFGFDASEWCLQVCLSLMPGNQIDDTNVDYKGDVHRSDLVQEGEALPAASRVVQRPVCSRLIKS